MARSILTPTQGALVAYDEWLEQSRHGDVLVYYTGDLQFDRDQPMPDEYDDSQRPELVRLTVINAIADRIRVDAGIQRVALTQRKIRESHYEYMATRLRPERERLRQAAEQSDAV